MVIGKKTYILVVEDATEGKEADAYGTITSSIPAPVKDDVPVEKEKMLTTEREIDDRREDTENFIEESIKEEVSWKNEGEDADGRANADEYEGNLEDEDGEIGVERDIEDNEEARIGGNISTSNDSDDSDSSKEEEETSSRSLSQKISSWAHESRLSIRIRRALYEISDKGYKLSWVFIILVLLSNFTPSSFWLFPLVASLGFIVSLTASFISSELLSCMYSEQGKARTAVLSVCAFALFTVGLYGIVISDREASTFGIIGLAVLSFVPSAITLVSRWGAGYRSYDYDEDGNVIDDGYDSEDEARYYAPSRTSTRSSSFSVINEIFGIPQPQDPPPIEVSRDGLDEKRRKELVIDVSDGDALVLEEDDEGVLRLREDGSDVEEALNTNAESAEQGLAGGERISEEDDDHNRDEKTEKR